jgi:hypothetical protein
MITSYLAIDPGAAGGIAWTDHDGIVRATKMPGTMPEQVDFLRARAVEQSGIIAVVEKTGGYMPGNSGPAAATFARHCGNLDAALYALGISVRPVSPSVWMKKLGMPKLTKPERKAWLKDFSARRYPHLTVTLATADALALLAWAQMEKIT